MKKVFDFFKKITQQQVNQLAPEIDIPFFPMEIWQNILIFLTFAELCNMARVAKRFYLELEVNEYWLLQIYQFLSTNPELKSLNAKKFFVAHYPFLKALKKYQNVEDFWKAVKPFDQSILGTLDVFLKNYLSKYISVEKDSKKGFPLIEEVATNLSSLNVLIEFYGFNRLQKAVAQAQDVAGMHVGQHFDRALQKAFKARNKECVQLLLDLGISRKFVRGIIDNNYIDCLSASILLGDSKFSNYLLGIFTEEEVIKTIDILLVNNIGVTRVWESIANDETKANIEKGLLQIATYDRKFLEHIKKQFFRLMAFDFIPVLDHILADEFKLTSKQLLADETKLLTKEINIMFKNVATVAINTDNFAAFSLLQKYINVNELFEEPILFRYIKSIDRLREELQSRPRFMGTSWYVKANYEFPLYNNSEVFSKGTPENCTHFIDLLVKLGADINAVDAEKTTVIEKAIQTGCVELVAALLKNGAVITEKAKEYSVPFQGIHTIIECVSSLQKKIETVQKDSLAKTNNNNNESKAIGLIKQGMFKEKSNSKQLARTELRTHRVRSLSQ